MAQTIFRAWNKTKKSKMVAFTTNLARSGIVALVRFFRSHNLLKSESYLLLLYAMMDASSTNYEEREVKELLIVEEETATGDESEEKITSASSIDKKRKLQQHCQNNNNNIIRNNQNETMKLLMQVSTPTAQELDPDEEYCFEESTIYEDKNAFILKLIEKIKMNPCLYDHMCSGWRSSETKKEVWEKIGKELQVDNGMSFN